MNIQTSVAPKAATELKTQKAVSAEANTAAPAEEKNSAPSESFTPEDASLSRGQAAWQGGIRKGVAWGKAVEKPLGGAAAIGLAAASGVALAFGGAVVGGIIGGGFGPVVSAITTKGAWNFLAQSFSNVGTAIQIGSTAGAVMGLAGGAILGKNLGDGVARSVAFVPGFVAGSVAGFAKPGSVPAPEHKDKEVKQRTELRGAFQTEGKVLSGLGVLSGAVGGFVGGAALTAVGSLVGDVASGDFTFKSFLSQVGTQALVGGAIGGVALAAVGGYGGEGIARASQWTYDKTLGRAVAGQPDIKERISKKQAELNERQSVLTEKSESLTKQTADYRAGHKEASDALTNRENKLSGDEKQVGDDLGVIDGRIEKNAQADYTTRSATPDAKLDAKGNHGIIGERGSLDQWDSKLTGWQGQLDKFRGELQGWEKKLDAKIDVDANAIFLEEKKPIDEKFGGLQKELDAFESKLNAYEADIKSRIADKYRQGINAEKPGVDAELNSARNDKAQSEREEGDARNQRDSASSRHDSAERQLSSAQSRLRNAESEESSLRSRINSLNSRISSLQSQLSSCRS